MFPEYWLDKFSHEATLKKIANNQCPMPLGLVFL